MPRPRFQISIRGATQAQINAAKTAIEAQLPNASRIFDRLVNWPQSVEGSGIRTTLHVRFKALADLDTLWPKIQNLTLAGVQGVASRHECSHDDAEVYNCKDDPRAKYQEKVF